LLSGQAAPFGDRIESRGDDQLPSLRREVDCVGDSHIVEALRLAVVEVGRCIDRPSDVPATTMTVERETSPVCESQRRTVHLSTWSEDVARVLRA
jgi:hypothetical protein